MKNQKAVSDALSIFVLALVAVTLLVSLSSCGGDGTTPVALTASSPIDTILISPSPSPTVSASPSPTPSPSPSPAWTGYNGSGVMADPYQLVTAQDVAHIADYPTDYFTLTQSIDMTGVTLTPIPTFSGVIQGHLHQLNNVTIVGGEGDNAAFVVMLTGIINQLYFQNLTVTSVSNFAAGFAFEVSGTIQNSQILSGTITSPLGGNGQNTGEGNPVYTVEDGGAVVTGDQSTVTFNGHNFFGTY